MNNSLRQYYLTAIGIRSWQLKSTADMDFNEYEALEDKKPLEKKSLEKKSLVVSHESLEKQSLVVSREFLVENQEPLAGDQEPSAGDQEPSADAQQPPVDKKLLVVNQEAVAAQKVQTAVEKISVSKTSVISPFDVELINTIEACNVCSNRQSRLKPLIGEGNTNAAVFFISDAPTAIEEREGHYLTGDIQFLFNSMLRVIGLENDYFFSGMIKCYSLKEYLISEDEINHCRTHLIAQLKHIKPKVIVALGPVQAQAILNTNKSFNQLRNKVHAVEISSGSTFSTASTTSTSTTQSCPVIVSYHPSFLLRNPLYKKEALKDLLLIKDLLEIENVRR